MILFYGEGCLGNQIFQYQALSQLARRNERIVAVGLENLLDTFELSGAKLMRLQCNGTIKRLVKYALLPLLIRPLARTLRLMNYVSETENESPRHHGPGGDMSVRQGLFSRVTFVDLGYYQSAALWPSVFPAAHFRIKLPLRDAARRFLDPLRAAGKRPSFVHVRRTDYLQHSSYGLTDFSLPADFYRRAITELEKRIGRPHLVFVTDDPAWVERSFADIGDKSVVSSEAPMDFAIMTECGSGIVSNSTFALAAAFMLDKPELVIAPRFWFGFRVQQWLPPRIEVANERLMYLPVLADRPAT